MQTPPLKRISAPKDFSIDASFLITLITFGYEDGGLPAVVVIADQEEHIDDGDAEVERLAQFIEASQETATECSRLQEVNAELLELAKQAEESVRRSKVISAPEDAEVEALCERIGYGAVMDAASRLWIRKDPVGAFVCGPCVVTVQKAIAKAEGRS